MLVYLFTNVNTCTVNYKLALANHQGLNHVLLQLLTFNTLGKEFRVESRTEAGNTWQNKSSDSWIFSGADFFEPTSCISLYLVKH